MTEATLDRVELWRVAHIEDGKNVKLKVVRSNGLLLMDIQLIHKNCEWLVSVLLAQLQQIRLEPFSVNCSAIDLDALDSTFY